MFDVGFETTTRMGYSTMATPTDTNLGQAHRLSDDQVRVSILGRLDESPHHELRHIHVDVNSERILLTGKVATFFMKQLAQETARQACDARKVINQVQVI